MTPSMRHGGRRLTLLDVLAIGVNAIVGSGVFSLPDDIQRVMGGFSPLAYLLCALVLIPVALCFAELASTTDRNGGPYLYAMRAFGPLVGFVVGWSCFLNAFISFAANASLFGELAGFGGSPFFRPFVVGIVLMLGAINYVGVKPGALLIKVMTIGKLAAIFAFLAVAVMHFDPSQLGGALPHGTAGVANGMYLALFPLQGFEVVGVPAGETKNPERSVPRATVLSLVFAALLFVVVQAVMVGSYPSLASESAKPLVDAARYLGPTLGALVLIGSIVSVGGFTAGSALGTPRYGQALAAGGDLPAAMARFHPRYDTPHIAIGLTTLLAGLLAALFSYRDLVGFSNVTVVFQYAATCVAVVVLRRREGMAGPGFRVPWGPLIPVIGAVGSVGLLVGSDRQELGFAVGGIAVGLLLRGLIRARRP